MNADQPVATTPCFRSTVRVYYEDTDAGGMVYHTAFLRFAERARTEWLRQVGFTHPVLVARHGVMIVVTGLEVRYRRPARLDDRLSIETRISAVGVASLRMIQRIDGDDGMPLVEVAVRLACLTGDGRPARFPDPVRRAFADWAATAVDRQMRG